MHIVLAHSHVNTFGGGERALMEVARELTSRHDVRLVLGGYDARRTYAGLSGLPHSSLSRWQWPIAHVAADAIVANSFGANLLALRNGARLAYWVHSTRSLFLQPGARRFNLRLRRALDWLVVRRAALLVANSRYTARRLWQLYRREADALVYPGVDLAQFQPADARLDGAPYAITVGRLSPEKGLDRLLDLWRDMPDLPLHVVGGGSPELVRELRSRSPQAVVWRGELTSADLIEAYQGAAVAVFTPRGEEFGIAPLEAMASGLPVVAWREGGLLETVVDGVTGYLVADEVTLRQRVRLLLHDEQRRTAMGAAARRRAEEFSWRRTALGLEQVCQRLVGQPAPAPVE